MLPLWDDNPTRRPAVLTVLIIGVCCWVFFYVQPAGREMRAATFDAASASCAELHFDLDHAAIPAELVHLRPLPTAVVRAELAADGCTSARGAPSPTKRLWLSVIVSLFLHGGLVHLGANMLFLWVFANNVEDREGHLWFAFFYVCAGIVATATQVALSPESAVPLIGASGAIAGVMGAYLVLYPRARVLTLVTVIPLRVPAWLLLGFWFASQFFVSPSSGVAWAAHVGGFVFGAVAGLFLRASAPPPRPARQRSRRA